MKIVKKCHATFSGNELLNKHYGILAIYSFTYPFVYPSACSIPETTDLIFQLHAVKFCLQFYVLLLLKFSR
jgi:hypothetical protein